MVHRQRLLCLYRSLPPTPATTDDHHRQSTERNISKSVLGLTLPCCRVPPSRPLPPVSLTRTSICLVHRQPQQLPHQPPGQSQRRRSSTLPDLASQFEQRQTAVLWSAVVSSMLLRISRRSTVTPNVNHAKSQVPCLRRGGDLVRNGRVHPGMIIQRSTSFLNHVYCR